MDTKDAKFAAGPWRLSATPDLYCALDTLVAVVGLTAFKYEGQREALQDAIDKSLAALAKARGDNQ